MAEQSTAPRGKVSAPTKTTKQTASAAPKAAAKDAGIRVTVSSASLGPIDITDLVKKPINGDADDRLRLLIERIERLEDEKKGIGDDIKDVFSEAKSTGYDTKTIRRILRLRKMKPDDRREAEAVMLTYCRSLGIETQGNLF